MYKKLLFGMMLVTLLIGSVFADSKTISIGDPNYSHSPIGNQSSGYSPSGSCTMQVNCNNISIISNSPIGFHLNSYCTSNETSRTQGYYTGPLSPTCSTSCGNNAVARYRYEGPTFTSCSWNGIAISVGNSNGSFSNNAVASCYVNNTQISVGSNIQWTRYPVDCPQTIPCQNSPGGHSSSKTEITWNWGNNTNANYIERSTNGSNWTNIGISSSRTDYGLACGNSYTRYIRACNAQGCSAAVSMTYSTQYCDRVVGGWSSCSASPSWGGFGACSVACGGGTQYRSCNGTNGIQTRGVYCDNAPYGNGNCNSSARPNDTQGCSSYCGGSDSQSCNTQACLGCVSLGLNCGDVGHGTTKTVYSSGGVNDCAYRSGWPSSNRYCSNGVRY